MTRFSGRARCPALFRRARAAALVLLPIALLALAPPARAEPVRVSAAADAGAAPVEARQQAQERAFVEAVHQTAQRLLPAALPEPRAAHLRQYLAPRAASLVQSFHDVAPAKAAEPGASPQASATPAAPVVAAIPAGPLTLDMDVEVNRAAVGDLLLRLGLLAGARHPHVFALRLGTGVGEQDLKPLAEMLALQGLTRIYPAAGQAPGQTVQVSLERVPQGFFKAVLRQEQKVFVADGSDLAQLWLSLWGQYFSAPEQQPGVQGSPLEVTGFASVDGVLDFTRTLASWDDCVREVQLHVVDIRPSNSAARWTVRVTNPERLSERLREYLPGHKLTARR